MTPEADGARGSLIHVMSYGPDGLEEATPPDLASARALLGRRPVTWINVVGNKDPDVLRSLQEDFGFHPLAIEDVRNARQRPKVEEYENCLFVVLRMAFYEKGRLRTEQLCLFVGDDFVVTVQEEPGDDFDGVRERVRHGRGRIRSQGADYLTYALADALVDGLFPTLAEMGDAIERLEDDVAEGTTDAARDELRRLRKEILSLRRVAFPQREAIVALERNRLPFIGDEAKVYFRDVADHAIRAMDLIDAHKELVNDVRDLYVTGINLRLNETMRVLTIIATIFIPLTFIAGVYGMNFEHMPELTWRYGYFAAIAGMGVVAFAMVWYFRRRGWV